MQQLSGLDTVFLNLETNAVPMHVGGVALLDPSSAPHGFSFAGLKKHIESRLHLLPMFRRRLLPSPLHLDQPYWVEDPDFDLENHVRHRALPSPGTPQQLSDFVCDVVSTRLDRSMPLWRIYYVEGLEGGRVAVITKIHHACIDGVSGAEMLSTLMDLSPEGREIAPPSLPWTPDTLPSPAELLKTSLRNFSQRPAEAWKLLKESAGIAATIGKMELAKRWAVFRDPPGPPEEPEYDRDQAMKSGSAPRMLFNTTINARRSYAFRSLPLADVKFVKNAFGSSVNDVVLCISAQALRDYLNAKNALPGKSLIAAIPVSVRSEDEKGAGGNKVTMARTPLGTHIADPVERLRAISGRMGKVKQGLKAVPARLIMDWANVPAPALMAQAARLSENFSILDYVHPPYNVVISNVPGPAKPLYFAGARVLANYPVSIPYHGLAFNITVMSYQNNLDIGLTGHRGTVPDPETIMRGMAQALADLKARAENLLQKSA
ncbi:MAG: wax ester/triacylglycerol synthase family O-acyltransferase [Pseudomonadota bacterium]